MKIFFLGDIHGNQFALKSILEHAKSINSDLIICTGDLSGYFFGINEVIELLKEYNVVSILGNHDAMLLGLQSINTDANYYPSFKKIKEIINDESLYYLKSLNSYNFFKFNNLNIKVYHGGPLDVYNHYVYPDKINENINLFDDSDIYLFGHSHVQFGVKILNQLFLNPGAVGLPRNGDYRAHGISFNTNTYSWESHKVNYDLDSFIKPYILDSTFTKPFIHNIMYGRSSSKSLNLDLLPTIKDQIELTLENMNIRYRVTSLSTICIIVDNNCTDYIIYFSIFQNEAIELTTSPIFFNWQSSFYNIKSINFDLNKLVYDSFGHFYKKYYNRISDFNNELSLDIDFIYKLFQKQKELKWENIIF